MLWVVDNLLLDHVELPQVVIVAVHPVHPETYLLKALVCQSTPSWLWVGGEWWPMRLHWHCHLLGLGVLSISHPHPHPQSQIPNP